MIPPAQETMMSQIEILDFFSDNIATARWCQSLSSNKYNVALCAFLDFFFSSFLSSIFVYLNVLE